MVGFPYRSVMWNAEIFLLNLAPSQKISKSKLPTLRLVNNFTNFSTLKRIISFFCFFFLLAKGANRYKNYKPGVFFFFRFTSCLYSAPVYTENYGLWFLNVSFVCFVFSQTTYVVKKKKKFMAFWNARIAMPRRRMYTWYLRECWPNRRPWRTRISFKRNLFFIQEWLKDRVILVFLFFILAENLCNYVLFIWVIISILFKVLTTSGIKKMFFNHL